MVQKLPKFLPQIWVLSIINSDGPTYKNTEPMNIFQIFWHFFSWYHHVNSRSVWSCIWSRLNECELMKTLTDVLISYWKCLNSSLFEITTETLQKKLLRHSKPLNKTVIDFRHFFTLKILSHRNSYRWLKRTQSSAEFVLQRTPTWHSYLFKNHIYCRVTLTNTIESILHRREMEKIEETRFLKCATMLRKDW